MRYLIDTHILFWIMLEPSRLTKRQRDMLQKSGAEIFVSRISFWEISLKYSLKKIQLQGLNPDELFKQAVRAGLQVTQPDAEVFASFYKLPQTDHKDPFDRMIAWEAINEKYTLISNDKDLSRYKKLGLKIAS